jgi:hypothetical protein
MVSFLPDGTLEPGKVDILVPITRGPMVFALNPAVIATMPWHPKGFRETIV